MEFKWEDGFTIATRIEADGAIVISANAAGLQSLANHFMALADLWRSPMRNLHTRTFISTNTILWRITPWN